MGTEILELFDKKDFKAAIIKRLQWLIMNMLETNEKQSTKQRNRNRELEYKEPNQNFKTEKYSSQNKLIGWAQQQNREDRGKNQWPWR